MNRTNLKKLAQLLIELRESLKEPPGPDIFQQLAIADIRHILSYLVTDLGIKP